jgi:adenylosuccinate synthase
VDAVVRYQGGNNAGHTVIVGREKFVFQSLPSGILRPGCRCVIGCGVVVDPASMIEEMEALVQRGVALDGNLYISKNAHLIMPYHPALDRASESKAGKRRIGTTGKGVGPAYADKAARIGIRMADLLDPQLFREKLEYNVAQKNRILREIYDAETFTVEGILGPYLRFAGWLAPYITDTALLLSQWIDAGRSVIFEGAQGTMLDLDHGTYPFITSSSTTAGGACTGSGIPPTKIHGCMGISKAYCTRVGEGPFPTEIEGPDQERLRELGGEYGTVTGRERRCGWLDIVGLRYAARLNGLTSLALTKLDVLSSFSELPVCVRYRLRDGTETSEFPAHQSDFHHCEPVYEVLPGWEEELNGLDDVSQLPARAREYVQFVERELGVEVCLIGTGASREHVLSRRGVEAVLG